MVMGLIVTFLEAMEGMCQNGVPAKRVGELIPCEVPFIRRKKERTNKKSEVTLWKAVVG